MAEQSERPHRKLLVWQKAMDLAARTYAITDDFPPKEQFGLSAQMRRASVSVISNIAEGAARCDSPDKARFFIIAHGSLSELDTQVELSERLRLLTGRTAQEFKETMNEVSYLLQGLIATQRAKGGRS